MTWILVNFRILVKGKRASSKVIQGQKVEDERQAENVHSRRTVGQVDAKSG